jgi:hypothetical protein
VLPADEAPASGDPWEKGFDAPQGPSDPGEPDEDTKEPLVVDEPSRRRFRRR